MRFLLCLGDVLVSLCDQGRLKAWDLKRRKIARTDQEREDDDNEEAGEGHEAGAICDTALEGGFVPTSLAHPPTYLNKVVVGSEGGALQLWNVRTGRYMVDDWGL